MTATPCVVAIIPARGGSKGLPGKNLRPLLGKPLIAYTIEAALQCPLVNRVIVSTDDPAIAEVAKRHGAEVPFLRPAELATDDARTEGVLQHAVEWLETHEGSRIDVVVFLQPTDLFRKRWMIEHAVRALLDDPQLDSAFVTYHDHKNYWRKCDGRYLPLAHRGYQPRQQKEPVYREDTGLACATRAAIIKQGRRIGHTVKLLINHDQASFVDIHDEFDLWMAERILAEGKRTIND